jgi:hypothetical protein
MGPGCSTKLPDLELAVLEFVPNIHSSTAALDSGDEFDRVEDRCRTEFVHYIVTRPAETVAQACVLSGFCRVRLYTLGETLF